jgi:hypothetical protein
MTSPITPGQPQSLHIGESAHSSYSARFKIRLSGQTRRRLASAC